ncbi:FecR family protein [Spirosoma linguale]|uniref:Anti-FecI sigma factor, FecR n=1 Tax=Spirosoma linguale (strain ATCC 33905 / DSM 74 / LMG 10896 / Claus 1) TaxID=504472 RepID=D2QF41_SPILD|nr:anti-FecI sigma factor, FecR [Spirosoma linguale DSM 74]
MEQVYENFSSAEFLTDDAFVHHQLEPTPQSTQFWAGWLAKYPHCQTEYQQAVDFVASIRLGLTAYAETEISEETIQQLLTRIRQTNAQTRLTQPAVRSSGWMQWAAAAAVFLALGVDFWWKITQRPTLYEQQLATLPNAFSEKINTSPHVQTIQLPDQSVVSLAPESRISYPTNFGQQNRTVYLSGEAAFSVTRNSEKPFLVHANEVVTKVLGTRFTVRAFAGENRVQVQVQSGQVSVYRNEPTNASVRQKGVMLMPNQQVVFNRETDQFDKMLVEAPTLVLTPTRQKKAPSFVYNDTPIPQVLQELTEAYGIDIRYNKEALANCQLNSSMTNESFEQKLTIVCATVGATYEIIDGQVIINGGNCQPQ